MRDIIKAELEKIEANYGVDILFAIESGSRSWGYHSEDSDYDVRFIYRRPVSWYLSIQDRRDVIEPKLAAPLDINGWDIKKALFQLHRGNPAFAEWLRSDTVYRNSPELQMLQKALPTYFNSKTAIYHYLHMASGNFRQYILNSEAPLLKKYLYVCRPLLCCEWIAKHNTQPPQSLDYIFNDWCRENGSDSPEASAILELINLKKNGAEMGHGPHQIVLGTWISATIEKFSSFGRTSARASINPDELNEMFMHIVL